MLAHRLLHRLDQHYHDYTNIGSAFVFALQGDDATAPYRYVRICYT